MNGEPKPDEITPRPSSQTTPVSQKFLCGVGKTGTEDSVLSVPSVPSVLSVPSEVSVLSVPSVLSVLSVPSVLSVLSEFSYALESSIIHRKTWKKSPKG